MHTINRTSLRGKPLRASFVWDRRAHVAVEVALSYPLILVSLIGTFVFGHALFTYNSLQSAVRNAGRYASLAPYDIPNGTNWEERVKNMAVFGDPDPAPGAMPLVPKLNTDNVTVNVSFENSEPERVTVSLANYEIDAYFEKFLISKPEVVFPYLGATHIP